jgi:hypothetical protein
LNISEDDTDVVPALQNSDGMIGADRLKNREASGFELVRDVKADHRLVLDDKDRQRTLNICRCVFHNPP